jgi:hypothetical protein
MKHIGDEQKCRPRLGMDLADPSSMHLCTTCGDVCSETQMAWRHIPSGPLKMCRSCVVCVRALTRVRKQRHFEARAHVRSTADI